MPRSHNLYRHGLTNATRNWANPLPERLRSPAYGDAGTIPLQVIEVQPLPANTVNGSGRDMPIFTTRLAPADATAYSVVTDWSGVVAKGGRSGRPALGFLAVRLRLPARFPECRWRHSAALRPSQLGRECSHLAKHVGLVRQKHVEIGARQFDYSSR